MARDSKTMDVSAESAEANSSSIVRGCRIQNEGRLIDAPNTRKQPVYQPKFSALIKKVIVELQRDPATYPTDNVIEWNKSAGLAEIDGFEIKGKGNANFPVRVLLYVDTHIEKFKLAPALAKLLDLHTDTLANIITAFWQYVKLNRLQETEDRRFVCCDESMQQIFNVPKIMFPQLPMLLKPHLLPCGPAVLEGTIRVDKEYHVHPQAFDIELEIEDPIRDRYKSAAAPSSFLTHEICVLDDKISAAVQSINLTKVRRDFMLWFAKDPVGLINQWVASQSRDLELILGDTRINEEEVRRSDFYKHDAVRETLFHYLRQKESL
ncbi:hypothetical protein BASA61_003162 [Batrachochytrium salamandrivorans]|nr:hypothetical protein BASA61_003162 [Batrachochytrium salamandrivorans]